MRTQPCDCGVPSSESGFDRRAVGAQRDAVEVDRRAARAVREPQRPRQRAGRPDVRARAPSRTPGRCRPTGDRGGPTPGTSATPGRWLRRATPAAARSSRRCAGPSPSWRAAAGPKAPSRSSSRSPPRGARDPDGLHEAAARAAVVVARCRSCRPRRCARPTRGRFRPARPATPAIGDDGATRAHRGASPNANTRPFAAASQ